MEGGEHENPFRLGLGLDMHNKDINTVSTSIKENEEEPTTMIERLEIYWANLFCWLPYSNYLFGIFPHPQYDKRNETLELMLNMKQKLHPTQFNKLVRCRGVFNLLYVI